MRAAIPCALLWLGALSAPASAGEDPRQLVTLPDASRATLREEMLGNLRAVQEILEQLAKGDLREAGTVAERELGITAMGRSRNLPLEARPGAHMPTAMHALGVQGHQAATAFAREAAGGNRDKALAALPAVTASCVACHHAYRLR